jgi:C1A family cysteine protease
LLSFKGNQYKPSTLPESANHAVLVVGYNDEMKTLEILNSFGSDWGDNGFARLSYEDFSRMAQYGFAVRLDGGLGEVCSLQ